MNQLLCGISIFLNNDDGPTANLFTGLQFVYGNAAIYII